jgi:DNA-binding CsgD family transcriptional regulator
VSRTRSVLIVHRENLAAEGMAAALARFPGILPAAVATTAVEAEACGREVDAVALDGELVGAERAATRLRAAGVRVVMLGSDSGDEGLWVSPQDSTATLASALVPGARDPRGLRTSLSPREREVLELVAKGLPGKQVARELGISTKTVEQHKSHIFTKLGVSNQTAAACLVVAGDFGGSF